MAFVALDTHMLDLFAEIPGDDFLDDLEAAEPPPSFFSDDEAAVWWLKALANSQWRGLCYTCSSVALSEVLAMPLAQAHRSALILSWGVEIREFHPDEIRNSTPEASVTPSTLQKLGLKSADALHVADAITVGASHFMTRDRGILKKQKAISALFETKVISPSEFVDVAFNSKLWRLDRSFN